MTVPVFVTQTGGQFFATLAGSPELRCAGPSRAEAIASLQKEVAQKLGSGELIQLEVPPLGVSGLAGIFRDDPELPGIVANIYRERAAEPRT